MEGLKGVVCQIDDILVFGSCQEEHDERLHVVLKRLQQQNVTLNPDKCEFSKKSITFLGQVIDQEGIRPDPNKVQAIAKMITPQCVADVRRFLGMVNQLNKFSPLIAEKSKPIIVKSLVHQRLRLHSKNTAWLTLRLKDISAYAPKIQLGLPLD